MADGNNPVMNVDLAFDVSVAASIFYGSSLLGIADGVCTFEVYSEHYAGDATTKNFMQEAATFQLDQRNRWAPVLGPRLSDVLQVCE